MFTAWILRVTNRLKPLLMKLLPIAFLRSTKKSLIDRTVAKLEDGDIAPLNRNEHPDGVNLIGFIRGEIGLGQSCRLLAWQLDASPLPFTVYNYEQISNMRHGDHSWDHKITNTTPYNINLIHINPYELPLTYVQMKDAWQGRYNIGFWLWELEEFPKEWLPALKLVDEVWTPSDFASNSIRRETDKPVTTIPYAIQAEADPSADRASFGLPEDTFLTLCMYDCNSSMERKNPMGAIRAYQQAYGTGNSNVGLIIKVNNPQKEDMDMLRETLKDYSNVYLIAETMDKPRVNALIALSDIYISLHRSEGFGLVPAEAMLLGTPVVATNWSANAEFMNGDVACMVDYTFKTIERDYGQYKKGNRWADANVSQAAGYLKRLYEDRDYYNTIARKAKAHIQQTLSLEQAANSLTARIQEIYQQHSEKGV